MGNKLEFEFSPFGVTAKNFEREALRLFAYQARNNAVYGEYLHHLGCVVEDIYGIEEIPCLPIRFFKDQTVVTGTFEPEVIFESSGTTGQVRSRHAVKSRAFYHEVCLRTFSQFYGSPSEYHVFALLPSYLERDNASLVDMMAYFIEASQSPLSGFFLHDLDALITKVAEGRATRKVLVVGVTFALLELAEKSTQSWADVILMETGGMKGRRKELVREELHAYLMQRLGVPGVHSEYGMTELLSQGYSLGDGRFETPPWMRIRLRDVNDPFAGPPTGRQGGINVIDLANVHSCAFLETQDLGRLHSDGSFEVLGRFDHSDLRGCNLMVL